MNQLESYNQYTVQKDDHLSIIIFGASGDLSKRKLFPSIFRLYQNGELCNDFRVIGYGRTKFTREEFIRDRIRPALQTLTKDQEELENFISRIDYLSGQYDQEGDYERLNHLILTYETSKHKDPKQKQQKLSQEQEHYPQENQIQSADPDEQSMEQTQKKHRYFYLSLPPYLYVTCTILLGRYCKMSSYAKKPQFYQPGTHRLVLEKPFGKSLKSFYKLSEWLQTGFHSKEEILLADHYLLKEIVENLIVLRFANSIFDPLWNRNSIQSVQLLFKESSGVEGRGGYYDNYGVIPDMIQNHMTQILSLVAMEPPATLNASEIQAEKVKVLKSIEPVKESNIVIGQYKGSKHHVGYRQDETVSSESNTPTFAACVLYVNNRRWKGVPFFVESGKALDENTAEIRIQFRDNPSLFNLYSAQMPSSPTGTISNELVIRIQPNESIYFRMLNKKPGIKEESPVESTLDLSYSQLSGQGHIPDAYERLLYKLFQGDETNFITEPEVEYSWKIYDDVLQKIHKQEIKPIFYTYGSQGPSEAYYLAAKHHICLENTNEA